MWKILTCLLLLPLLSCAQGQGVSLRSTNGVVWNGSISNRLVAWGMNPGASAFRAQYPNYSALLFATNSANYTSGTEVGGSIAVPNDFMLYDRVGNFIWFWPSHSSQNTFGVPTDGMLMINGARDVDILLGPNGGGQLGRSGNSYNGTFYLQYNETLGPNSAQLQWRANRADSDRAYPGIVGRHEVGDAVGHGHLDFYSKSPNWNTFPSGGFSTPGTRIASVSPNAFTVYGYGQVTGSFSNNLTRTFEKQTIGGATISPPSYGLDITSGTFEDILLGGNLSSNLRTSGQNKYGGISFYPTTDGNARILGILWQTYGGSGALAYYGGGSGAKAAMTQHSFFTGTTPTVNGAGTEWFRITSGIGIGLAGTVTTGGTTGNQTINKPSGTVNFAAAATTLTVTCDKVTASSIVFAVVQTADATALIKNVVPGAGSFIINLNAAATAETKVGFLVVNPI